MKRIPYTLLWLLVCSLALPLSLSAQKNKDAAPTSFTTPVDYWNFIGAEFNAIVETKMDYISKSVHSNNAKKIEARRQEVIGQINTSMSRIKNAKPYPSGEDLKSDVQRVLKLMLDVFTTDFKDANVLKETSEESYEAMENYFKALERANDKLDVAAEQMDVAQDTFALRNNIKVTKTETPRSKVLKKVSELNAMKNALYLSYFRVAKQNARFNDAMKATKADKMEEARLSVLEATAKSLAEVRAKTAFYGDDSYRSATIKLLTAFENRAKKEYVAFTKFYQLEESKRTQKDVDAFNAAVKTSNDMNKVLEEWNAASDAISQKFVPRKL